ncbi:hypothetical protein R1flu_020025 [Riccia fluitans]|uniref:Fucosyltransferase n=1 Tax=Riccia fluitans TaxID=41844 RepID=A0ABD1ZKS2_9MARC
MNSTWLLPDDLRFFCQGEQTLLDQIPWLSFWSNNYVAPCFYFLPSFQAKLHKWFTDRALFLHAGRYLLSSRDEIWTRITRLNDTYMASADHRVGIQVRAWDNKYYLVIGELIMSCTWRSGLLPKLVENLNSKFGELKGEESEYQWWSRLLRESTLRV